MFQTQNLYQNDEKWKNTRLGNSSETIGGWGCLMTSATMMLNGIGYNETPETVNEKMKQAGGFQGALFIPSVLPMLWPNCAYLGMQPCENSTAPLPQIDAALAAGKPVILQVDWNKQAGIQTHFVLVKDKRGNDYVLYDPYKYAGDGPDRDVLLTTRYKYNGATLEKEISGVLRFEALNAAPPATPRKTTVPLPAEKYTLYACEDDLALRSAPSTDGYLWKRLVSGTALISLESKAAAKVKLGVNGQWLNVQDPTGDQGYVAAWYVSETQGSPIAQAAAITVIAPASPQALPPGSLAFVPLEELAFRSQPAVDAGLIRRVPVTETLICVEPARQAVPKVGQIGQWLRMRDLSMNEGYVAAWYVRYASGSQPAGAVTSASANGGPLQVKATAEAIALRSQQVISDATVIKRLPLGTVLTVTEANAEGKVGRSDQWLKVKDPAGTEGYVAAWFVAR
jgi:hypothetical protein